VKTTDNGNSRRVQFDDAFDLIKAASAPTHVADKFRSSLSGSSEFTGTQDIAEALQLAKTGWDGGNDTIKRFKTNIEDLMRGQIPIPSRRFALKGKRIDMGRYMTGMPDSFVEKYDRGIRRESYAPRILRIVVNITASGAISPDTILRRGAALVVLIDTLERRRIRCSVDLVAVTSNRLHGGDSLEYAVNIKRDSEYLSIDKLVYFTGHASALRRLVFSLAEHEDNVTRKRFGIGQDMGSYGLPGEASERGDIYLPRMLSSADWSEGLTLAWLTKTMREQGIVLQAEERING
jgi:hypothetical protein